MPDARSDALTIFDVSPCDALKALAVCRTAERAYCGTNHNVGSVFSCAPGAGDVLKIDDL